MNRTWPYPALFRSSLSAAIVVLWFGAQPVGAAPEGLSSSDWQGIRAAYEVRQEAYLKSSKTDVFHQFGHSVAVSGDTVVVGATGDGSTTAEAAYVFVRSGASWTQQAVLETSKTQGERFGYAVAVSGDTIVVGAYGENSSTTGVNSTPNDSAPVSGAAYVFVRSGNSWTQQAYLKASNAGEQDWFGISVAVAGDTVVVGAPFEDSSNPGVDSTPNESAPNSGAAYVFVRSGTSWSQQAYLKASNTETHDQFGLSVSVSGDTVVVGAPTEGSDTSGVSAGAAYVFVRSGTSWSEQAYLKASNADTKDGFGVSVAVSGDTVVVGAYAEASSTRGVNSTPNDHAPESGAAYVFVRSGTWWTLQAYLKASNTGEFDHFGIAVAVAGNTVVVGAPGEASSTTGVNGKPNEFAPFAGAAYVFVRSGTSWTQQAYLKASNAGELDQFGFSLAVSGDTVVVGAYAEGDGTTSSTAKKDPPKPAAANFGAAYVFVGTPNG